MCDCSTGVFNRERPTVCQTNRTWLLAAHLVPYGFLGWKVEGVHLWKLGPQVVVELPELGVAPVHIPLIVQDTDVHLSTGKRQHHHHHIHHQR